MSRAKRLPIKRKYLAFGSILMLALLVTGVAWAAVETGYDLSWWTVDSGGGTSSGNGYTLNGTLGQPDAGMLARGGGYTLAGGFWHGGVVSVPQSQVYLPLLVK